MSKLEHPNEKRLHGSYEAAKKFYLVLELCSMDLRERLRQLGPTTEAASDGCLWRALLPPQQVRRALVQVASALAYLHGIGLAHADPHAAQVRTAWAAHGCRQLADGRACSV